ncbi:hypothetical protein ABT237_24120 [Streptomyces sp. NPDC001581]
MTQHIQTVLPFVLEGWDGEFPLVARLGYRPAGSERDHFDLDEQLRLFLA